MYEKTMVENHLNNTAAEVLTLTQMNEQARIYRHDMRHHFAMLLSMVEEGLNEEAISYLHQNIKSINDITPRKFTTNQMLNLTLSHLAEVAETNQVSYEFDIKVDEIHALSDTELCAVVSNAIENSLNAVDSLVPSERRLSVKLSQFNGNLVFNVENPYTGDIEFEN